MGGGLLGNADEAALREAFISLWVASWLRPPREVRYEVEKRPLFARRTHPHQKFLVMFVDSMKELFGRVMCLSDLEQVMVNRLVAEFARALCGEPSVQDKLKYVLLPEAERPGDIRSPEEALERLAHHTISLNTSMHKTPGRRQVLSRNDFAARGRLTGFQEDFCKKIFDLVKTQPFL